MRTEAQIAKAEKLSAVMIEAITRIGAGRFGGRSGTILALIARGILTTATSETQHQHLLTDKGESIHRELTGVDAAPEITVEPAAVDADDIVIQPSRVGHYTTWTDAIPVPRFTAKIVERDESAEFLARHPEQQSELPPTYDAVFAHKADRDKLARSIAYEFSHIFVTWSVGEEPDVKIKPRELDRPQMLRFYQNGSMYQPGQLLAEIRDEMADRIADADTEDHITRMNLVNALMWLGWLNAYVLESGKLDGSGWQDRVRGPQDGWEGMGLYSTEPSDETELPAWADLDGMEEFGCRAVISPQGRWDDAETCTDGVTREEYYTHGEHALCDQHRLAKIALDDRGW